MFGKPRKAATVAVLKNNPSKTDGFEVLLLKRHKQDRFLPSYYVFPGGAIDEQDSIPDKGENSMETAKNRFLSLVIPVYNEEEVLETSFSRLFTKPTIVAFAASFLKD